MSDEQANAISQLEPEQEVDRIRDIIFGHQMRDYDQRFQIVRRDLERLQQEMDRLAERLAERLPLIFRRGRPFRPSRLFSLPWLIRR